MNSLQIAWTVMRKELVDLFRDRRTVMLGLFMTPLLLPALLLGMGSLAEKRAKTQLENKLELPVMHAERAPNLIAFLETYNIEVLPPPDDVDAVIRDQSRDVVLAIGEQYGEQWRASDLGENDWPAFDTHAGPAWTVRCHRHDAAAIDVASHVAHGFDPAFALVGALFGLRTADDFGADRHRGVRHDAALAGL